MSQDIVARVRAKYTFTDPPSFIPFLVELVKELPVDPTSGVPGLLSKNGGENITFYEPVGVNISISRVCYPNGQIFKVLSDAGPGGVNGPIWHDDGLVNAGRYVAVAGAGQGDSNDDTNGHTHPVDPTILAQIASLVETVVHHQQQLNALHEGFAEISNQIRALNLTDGGLLEIIHGLGNEYREHTHRLFGFRTGRPE